MNLLLIGMGPGMGWALAKKFGQAGGYRILMTARTQENLRAYQKDLAELGVQSAAYAADLADAAGFEAVLKAILAENEVDMLLFNASAFNPGAPSQIALSIFLSDFQTNVAAALQAVQAVLPGMKARGRGKIFFTGGGSALSPSAYATSLSVGKAGMRNLALALADELRSTDIQTATVTVCGQIVPGGAFDPARIADEFWRLHELPKTDDRSVESVWK